MKIFITGTDTNVGKTIVSSWICLHTGFSYIKPIQTGYKHKNTDAFTVKSLSNVFTYKENYIFKKSLSPHLAAYYENKFIRIDDIRLPNTNNLIIEGIGGVLVPINAKMLVIDLIIYFSLPVILVSKSVLGTINHTLLSIEVMRSRKIKILGVILVGPYNQDNIDSIEFYGKVKVLDSIPNLKKLNKKSLSKILFSDRLRSLFGFFVRR
ncbi:dethiobiotin synthase [Candidatus Legionella polyplacis]|uniref:dethiobiotin synthase n=1 Tax=Candidatus Legionella polyplacis TaxID=2005262 RepID=UPI000C1E892B|nr:dethiobiotin synthase [Candidatus Legionella polyplacis]ATW01819.1 dethiobiotin synthase [Candidatus Legionella polyplacis]